jgi:hypothetical protein
MISSLADQKGAINVLLIPLILSVVLLLGSLGFGAWAYTERQDYKNNVDEKVASATEVAVEKAKTEKDNEFLQREKEPHKIFTSPAAYGNFSYEYPKTWSTYANEVSNAYSVTMQPDVVSSNNKTAYALKVEIINQPYSATIHLLDNDIKLGKLKASAITLPKVPGVTGLRVDGVVALEKNGSAIYMPLREKTIRIVSEAPDKVADLNATVLPSFTYIP